MHTVSRCVWGKMCFNWTHKDKTVYLPSHTPLGKLTYFSRCWIVLKIGTRSPGCLWRIFLLKESELCEVRNVAVCVCGARRSMVGQSKCFYRCDSSTRKSMKMRHCVDVQDKRGTSHKERRSTRVVLNQHGCQWELQGPNSHLSNTLCTLDCRSHCCLPVIAHRADVVLFAYCITRKE